MTDYRIMTLNTLTERMYGFGKNKFAVRCEALLRLVEEYQPDIIGTQELLDSMLPALQPLMDRYEMTGKPRHSRFGNEYSAILFRKDRFELVRTSTKWLSDTPDLPGSKFAFSQFPRIVTTAELKDRRTGETIIAANTHLDQILRSMRRKQADVLCTLLSDTAADLTVITGDFNDIPGSPCIQAIEDHGFTDAVSEDTGSTLRGRLGSLKNRQMPIDHIFIKGNATLRQTLKIRKQFDGIHPSDHYPVMTLVRTD